MYKTDKQREKEGLLTYYTAPQLDQACADYFSACDADGTRPTKPGLLLHLGVTEKEWKVWEAGEPGYKRHPQICQKAMLEIRNRLEQRTDAAAIFLLKQKPYGGYTDRPEADGAGLLKVSVSFGTPPKGRKDKRTQ
ncbi:hypothetical protein [Flavonifractor sp. An4]|uniref:hypothetical protein n=1 Tax=Flavonifractor sp. An4 TaxID=1965634 RepID=UPI000B38CFCB|nr:hypothetical protein [Flavonifractor sp. An4]OUO17352.1 hypothetical protein B5F94_03630 [Flavonifractor sp. An4]